MTEIKFRAWTGLTMEYNVTVGKFGAFYVNPGAKGNGLDEKDTACLTSFTTKYSQQTPLMQFTGLHDKNGKEIYEGDILCYRKVIETFGYKDSKSGKFVVKKRPNPKEELHYWEVFFSDTGEWQARRNGIASRLFEKAKNHEVVGDIYENPDLLKIV